MQDDPHGTDAVLARLEVHPGRRVVAMAATCGLALVLIWNAFSSSANVVGQVALILCGVGLVFAAQIIWRGTAHGVELTATGLRDSDGTPIADIADITLVERGMFALKPSNGFSLRLSAPGSRVWHTGVWWRYGTRVGVGGMTPMRQSKMMAEQVAHLIAERDGQR